MSAYDLMPCKDVRHPACNIAHSRLNLESRMIRALIRDLKIEEWLPLFVHTDRYDSEAVIGERQTLDAVFSADESTITFEKNGRQHGVLVVLGNGIDCIADYSLSRDESDDWNATMDRVTDTLYALFESEA